MQNVPNKINELDGIRLYHALVAGMHHVISRQAYLNKINVFPVADADTGTNMAMTLNVVIERTAGQVPEHVGEMLAQVADAALEGARGNSGAILAQFFQGMSDSAESVERMQVQAFAKAVDMGAVYAYKALSNPQEGTILTVLADFAKDIKHQVQAGVTDFPTMFNTTVKAANKSLENTPNQLKVLKKAGVVDSGAQGFVDMLHGMMDSFKEGKIKEVYQKISTTALEKIESYVHKADDLKYRYCTECIISGTNIDHAKLRERLDKIGDSLVIAGSPRKAKVHIHVNKPTKVFALCRKFGTLSREKADDMKHQEKSTHRKHSKVAILTDSAADIPEKLLEKLDIYVVPLHFNFGDENFVDKVSITTWEFVQKLKTSPHHPRTSQPSNTDIRRQLEFLASHYDSVVSIHVSSALSGTYSAAKQIAAKMTDHKITVMDSHHVTVTQGLIVTHAAQVALTGASHDAVVKAVEDIIPKTELYVGMPDMTYAVRGGRVSPAKKRLADFLRLTPILGMDTTGKVVTAAKIFGKHHLAKRTAKKILKRLDPQKTYKIAVAHMDNARAARTMLDCLQKALPHIKSSTILDTGAVIGSHAGIGCFGVAVQEVAPG